MILWNFYGMHFSDSQTGQECIPDVSIVRERVKMFEKMICKRALSNTMRPDEVYNDVERGEYYMGINSSTSIFTFLIQLNITLRLVAYST